MLRRKATAQKSADSSSAIDPSIGAVADLPARIHAATRSTHANLNRLITARLPLCLPPHASTPQLYAFGISRFAEIYYAFEQAWISQVSGGVRHGHSSESLQEDEYDVLDSFINDGGGRITNILRQIYDPELLRSDRLRTDLLSLKAASDGSTSSQHLHSREKKAKGKRTRDDGGKRPGVENAATEFASHIKSVTEENPHLLLAYTWIMYMALFNGGRWIQNKLVEGGADFWDPLPASSPSVLEDQYPDLDNISDRNPTFITTHLSFWSFPSSTTGNNNNNNSSSSEIVKSTFRNRFLAAEMLLTEAERNQIIDETIEIFRRCGEIVNEIDLEVARGAYRESRYPSNPSSSSSSSSSNTNSTTTITGIPSITIQSPSTSSSSGSSSSQGSVITTRQPEPGRRPRRRLYINPFLAGAAGLFGGLCAWFWNANSEAVQWGYRSFVGG